MFGDRFAADDLARNFKQRMAKLQSLKKIAHDQTPVTSEVKPEDFLVSSEDKQENFNKDLDDKIESVSNYASDKVCSKCHKVECECKEENEAKDQESDKEDVSYLVDKKAEYVLHQLGKIASGLRQKNENFAADMVEATAIEIKDQAVAKASQKLQVIAALTKMAHKSYQSNDHLTGDVIAVTIENIKKAN